MSELKSKRSKTIKRDKNQKAFEQKDVTCFVQRGHMLPGV